MVEDLRFELRFTLLGLMAYKAMALTVELVLIILGVLNYP